ncbi:MAG: NifB/NifX family molybdenum-iron cluster-binding protein [Candidatus Krumholzibacteriota bacterium]|nr:NifB/NifX family molybdenum-iron cluster-binding protein [Candidatus Krumholzibacteriota bacterium]
MKIAITAVGPSEEDEMDQRFGRTKYFMIYDTEAGEYQSLSNSSAAAESQGAGIRTGELLSNNGVGALITGHVGPKAFSTLIAAKIKVFSGGKGKVSEIVSRYLAGELKETKGPDVNSHWT